jgi:hypothetical protein
LVFTVRGLVHRSTEISSEIEIKIRIQDLGHVFTDMDARLATGVCVFSGYTVSSTNKPERHDITEILLKVA